MNTRMITLLAALAALPASTLGAQTSKYPPLDRYLMSQEVEIALARTAAPPTISDRATIKLLTASGFTVAREGDNENVCMVMRAFSAPTYTPAQFRDLVHDPTVHAPICFTAPAARTGMPYYEMRTRLAMEDKNPGQIAEALQAAYVSGQEWRLRPA
ncbi:MAG: hypothetical protein ABIP93_07085 [Gemmatimonadaceae bacterium]